MRKRYLLGAMLALGSVVTPVAVTLMAGGLAAGAFQDQTMGYSGPQELTCLDRILGTVRTIETGGRPEGYAFPSNKGGASGAYQFIDSTWRAQAGRAGVDVSSWPSAYMAPPAVQDQVAGFGIAQFLRAGNAVEQVPVYWYLGHPIPSAGDPEWDTVPMPEAGNVLTPRQYQSRWLAELAKRGGCSPTPARAPAGQRAPITSGQNGRPPSVAQYGNGQIPLGALVEVQPGRYLAPEVAADWLAMARAAAADGVTLTITSAYRSQAEQQRIVDALGLIANGGLGAPVGVSPHGDSIATDMDVIPPAVFPWLSGNASRFCFGNLVEERAKARERWHWARVMPLASCTAER